MKKLFFSLGLMFLGMNAVFADFKDIQTSDFRPYILQAEQAGVINGYSDGTFRPNNTVSFIESLKILINAGPQKTLVSDYATTYDKKWSDPFKRMYDARFLMPAVSFYDDTAITRDFAVYLMLRQLGIELEQADIKNITNRFPDIKDTTTLSAYILFAKFAGITDGYSNGTFGPKNNVTRGELTKMAWRTLVENKSMILQKYTQLTGRSLPVTQGEQVIARYAYFPANMSMSGASIHSGMVVVGASGSLLPAEISKKLIGANRGYAYIIKSGDIYNTCSSIGSVDLDKALRSFDISLPRYLLESSYTTTVPKSSIGTYNSQGVFVPAKSVQVGEMVTAMSGNGTLSYLMHGSDFSGILDMKVTAIDGDSVTIYVAKNTQSPFYGKELAVGLEGVVRNFQYWKITKLDAEKVYINIRVPDAILDTQDDLYPGKVYKKGPTTNIITQVDFDHWNLVSYWIYGEPDPECQDVGYYLVQVMQ